MTSECVAWFNPFSGIAGDMALGAAIAAGAEIDHVVADLESLGLDGWSLQIEHVLRGGIAATHAVVRTEDGRVHRTASEIIGIVEDAGLSDRVRERATATFRRLATVEGRLHRRPPGEVHLHEVGGLDAIVDVVGTCSALESLGVDRVVCAPLAVGTGTITASHGVLPVPPPAVAALLEGAPVRATEVDAELTTPTGAALMATLAEEWGALPSMTIRSTGYGAGTRDLADRPNAVQLVVGTTESGAVGRGAAQPLLELAVNVDDATGETLAHTIEVTLAAGAVDAWIVPVIMKKGRPGHLVAALCDASTSSAVAEALVAETGSFGVRARPVERWAMSRRFDTVDVDGHPIRIKVAATRTKVEHDDAASVARRTGRSLREVVSLAEEAARRRPDRGPDEPA